MYLQPTATAGVQVLRGVIYADAGGVPGALVGVSSELSFASTHPAGWYALPFAAPVNLAAGRYWIGVLSGAGSGVAGFRWDWVAGSRVFNLNTYAAGASDPFGGSTTTDGEQMSIYASYTAAGGVAPPVNSALPVISGTAQVGQRLSASTGSWSGSPSGYSYQWRRCDASGGACSAVSGATSSTYDLVLADRGFSLRVVVSAINAGGTVSSSSAPTAVVQDAPAAAGTFGKTSLGASSDTMAANRKRVNAYTITAPVAVSKLSMYLQPTATPGTQALRGVIYADAGGAPGALLASSTEFSYASTQPAGWYALPFAAPVNLAAGRYWIGVLSGAGTGVAGFRWDWAAGSRIYNLNTYTTGASNPFGGSTTTDGEQMSIYASYTAG